MNVIAAIQASEISFPYWLVGCFLVICLRAQSRCCERNQMEGGLIRKHPESWSLEDLKARLIGRTSTHYIFILNEWSELLWTLRLSFSG